MIKMNEENVLKGIIQRLYETRELRPSEVLVLKNYITKLQNNWNELKKWLEDQIKDYREKEWFPIAWNLNEVLEKMQELENK